MREVKNNLSSCDASSFFLIVILKENPKGIPVYTKAYQLLRTIAAVGVCEALHIQCVAFV